MGELTIEVQERTETGKNRNRRLRASGVLPAVVYGAGRDPIAIQVEQKTMHQLLEEGGGENAVFLLKLAGTEKSRHTMVRKIDVDPISRRIQHVDFLRVDLTKKVRVQVHIEVTGEAHGVKTEDGVLDFVTRSIEVECLPNEIPQLITVDVTDLHIGQHLEVKDLEVGDNVEVVDDPDRVVVSVAHSRVAATLEEADEGEEDTLIEAEMDEPEVIGRGKEEAEGDEAG